jgi:hypothetical protein
MAKKSAADHPAISTGGDIYSIISLGYRNNISAISPYLRIAKYHQCSQQQQNISSENNIIFSGGRGIRECVGKVMAGDNLAVKECQW